MMITNNREEWEWRELTWPDTLTPDTVRNALEQLAASGALGPVTLETRATKAGLRTPTLPNGSNSATVAARRSRGSARFIGN